jgi:hypothetical protein
MQCCCTKGAKLPVCGLSMAGTYARWQDPGSELPDGTVGAVTPTSSAPSDRSASRANINKKRFFFIFFDIIVLCCYFLQIFVTALNAVTGQLVDEPRALAVGGPGGPWNCKYLHQPA